MLHRGNSLLYSHRLCSCARKWILCRLGVCSVGVRRSRVQTLATSGNAKAQRLLNLLDDLNAYISATQLGITMASLALGWIGEPVFAHLLEAPLKGRVSEVTLHTISFAVAFTIITFLHIVLGELAPKTLALERAEKVALAISWPMQAFYKLFRWPIGLLDWAGTRTVRLFGLHPTKIMVPFTLKKRSAIWSTLRVRAVTFSARNSNSFIGSLTSRRGSARGDGAAQSG